MLELKATFTSLYKQYESAFGVTTHEGTDRDTLMRSVRSSSPGVYIICAKGENPLPLYIGSSGKIGPDLTPSGSNVRKRLFWSNTPYHFDRKAPFWRYDPTTSGVPPGGYSASVPVADLLLTIFALPHPYCPAVLEHLLLQGFINEFGRLPAANQKI
jgi:hypothetical protein